MPAAAAMSDARSDVVPTAESRQEPATRGPVLQRLTRGTLFDFAIFATYALLGLYVLARVWHDPAHRVLLDGDIDPAQFQWFIAVDTYAVTHLHNPLFTTALNAPDGVNLMGNASILGLAVPLIPITLLFGVAVTYALTISGGLAATAAGWYWVFNREFRLSRAAAAIGGVFCGFAPPIISHANAHANFTAMFVLPFIVRAALRLRDPDQTVRSGIVLGLLVTWQVFIGEEILLFAALGLGVFVLVYAMSQLDYARSVLGSFLRGLGVAAVVAGVLLAYPLWFQFYGPQHWSRLDTPLLLNDVSALTAYATNSLGFQPGSQVIGRLAINPTEQNAFFGWSLFPVMLVVAVALWRNVAARTCAIVAGLFLVFSLGSSIHFSGNDTGIPGPWALVDFLPLLDSVMPGRLTLVAIPAIAALLAFATHHLIGQSKTTGVERATDPGAVPAQAAEVEPSGGLSVRAIWGAALAAALLPLFPMPLQTMEQTPTPRFFTSGTWKQYVAPGRTLVAFPVSWPSRTVHPMFWQVASDLGWNAAGGYFVGPHGPDSHGGYGADYRNTSLMFAMALNAAQPVEISDANRAAVREDLRWWRADAVVLVPQPWDEVAQAGLEGLLGPGTEVDGVLVWDVRSITR